MAIIQDIVNFMPSWRDHLSESGYLKADKLGDYHQKAGYNFKENFPNTPEFVADALGKAYQYSTEGVGSLFSSNPSGEIVDYLDSTTKDPSWAKRAKEESRLNSLGFRGQGFNMDEYNQTMDFARKGFDPQTGLTYGSAQASDLPTNSLERDFPGMSTGDIIEMMNNREFIGNQITPMAKPIDRSNVIGRDLEADAGTQIVDGLKQPYTIRGQIADDFGKIKNKIGSGLGSLKDFAVGKGKKGWNLGKMAMSGIGNAIMPGLGFLMSNLKPEPLYRETLANSRKANPLATRGFETIDGTRTSIDGVSDFGGFTTDDLGRITQTGDYITPENIMSGYNAGFDLAGSALDRIGNIKDLMAKDPKSKWHQQRIAKINALKTAAVASAQAKRQAYQDKIDRAKNAAAAQKARAKSITAGYGGHDHSPGATGPTAAGAGMGVGGGYASDYGFLKDGGRVGYANGGLASLFTRRG